MAASFQNARAIASQALNRAESRRLPASTTLEPLLGRTDRPQQATDLVFGTIRNRLAIDNLISQLANCPVNRISQKILTVLRIGTYELVYNVETPEYSAVDEAVELGKMVGGRKQGGFVNAVLRNIQRAIVERNINLQNAKMKRTLPRDLNTGCQFDREILPDAEREPVEYYNLAFSLPKFVVSQWLDYFGSKRTKSICFACNRKPSIYLRPNPLKTEQMDLWAGLVAANVKAEALEGWPLVRLEGPAHISSLAGFEQGHFTVQDYSAYQPVALLDPQAGKKILDFCSAPGTKTTQLAEATGDSGRIIATDTDSMRLKKVSENVKRLGLRSVEVMDFDKFDNEAGRLGPFDYIFLDVPCSNTAVLSRRPEARYRITRKSLTGILKTQADLLEIAVSLLSPEGRICYSTCALLPDENHCMVEKFLAEHSDFKLEADKLTVPMADAPDHDGGYAAVLVRE